MIPVMIQWIRILAFNDYSEQQSMVHVSLNVSLIDKYLLVIISACTWINIYRAS